MALDSSAFYAGVPYDSSSDALYVTTPLVYDEISHIKSRYGALKILVASGRLSISQPGDKFAEIARRAALRTGDLPNLSSPDLSLIALCVRDHTPLVTDDFALSNVAKSLSVPIIPIMTKGITRTKLWQYYCPGCKKDFSRELLEDAKKYRYVKGERTVKIPWRNASKRSSKQLKMSAMVCDVCGSILKRKPRGKKQNKQKTTITGT